jgi:hypothetical protein
VPAETPAPVPEPAPRIEGGGPTAAARQVLADMKRSTATSKPATKAAMSSPPPVPQSGTRHDEVVGSGEATDLTTLRPATPTEVVELAVRHLGLSEGVVVERARQMLPPRVDSSAPRDPSELVSLWLALVAEHRPDESGPPAATDSDDDNEAIHLDELIDARSHSEDVIDQLTEAFPGAELITVDEEEKP